MSEERLEKIEIKITDLEDTVQVLNRTVYEQQKIIDQLQALCGNLVAHVKELSEAGREVGSANEPPPHY